MTGTGIVMITRDRRERTLATLEQLVALPEQPPVVVVDNGSRDGTADAVAARHPDVRVIRSARNHGAAARTIGARALDTEFVAFSDDDSWWAPGAIRTGERLLREHPRLGLVAARTLVGPDETEDPLNAVLADSPLGTAADLPGPSVLGFLACASIVRRSAFLEAGGFSPVLHFGSEETLLAIDLATAGWGVAYCPEVVAHHHPADGGRPGRVAQLRRNALLTTWLRRPWPVIAADTAALARSARDDAIARRALVAALSKFPDAMRHRRRLPGRVEKDLERIS
ncbi:glycosyltransferase family 2 protein [Cryptosporangium phraense]|uniref:Glycosyltransferase n=1 Tax=Cryptosporangium phraense TaxID=2593070 RepID=A0A545AX76_9ACTN|nr:glycosyltransferase [Cryptosporangium phraense]TQS45936.1 glycosyltransferase [Cryptosporangium phraense]